MPARYAKSTLARTSAIIHIVMSIEKWWCHIHWCTYSIAQNFGALLVIAHIHCAATSYVHLLVTWLLDHVAKIRLYCHSQSSHMSGVCREGGAVCASHWVSFLFLG